MLKRQRSARKADRPIIDVREVHLDSDWYTPKLFKVSPIQVSVTFGKKGNGRVRCEIEESEWERRCVELRLIFEDASAQGGVYTTGLHSDISNEFGKGDAGTFTGEQIDWLIRALTAARDEAEKRGLFTPRPTPTTLGEVLAAGKHPRQQDRRASIA